MKTQIHVNRPVNLIAFAMVAALSGCTPQQIDQMNRNMANANYQNQNPNNSNPYNTNQYNSNPYNSSQYVSNQNPYQGNQKMTKTQLVNTLNLVDLNRDRYLDQVECYNLASACNRNGQQVWMAMLAYDYNGDGRISFNEALASEGY